MNFNSLFIKSISIRSQLCNYQTVRWRRVKKPFWLGIAKSKMFIIPQTRKVLTTEEKTETASLIRHYRTTLNSLMKFIQVENPGLSETFVVDGDKIKMSPELEKSISESFKINESWNTESAKRRDERMKENMEKQMEKAIKELDVHEEMRMKQLEIIEEIVKKEKQMSGSFITPENLDEAIENCLNKIDCYDFAIDTEGNKYHGRESLPSQLNSENKNIPVENVS